MPQLNQSDPIFFNAKIVSLDHLIYNHCYTRKKGRVRVRLSHVENGKLNLSCRFSDLRKQSIGFRKPRRIDHLLPLVSADDGVTVNGSPQAETDNDVEELRYKLNHSLQDEDYNTGLVQLLYDAARVLERAIKEQSSLSKKSWFSTAWFGVDRNACVKAISYQASVYCLLQAANEISSRGDGKDRDINVFVQRREGFFSISGNSSARLLGKRQICIAAITKLGQTKVSCAQFFSIIPDVTGRLMDMLVDFVPVHQCYILIEEIGLRREFLIHFGPRSALCRIENVLATEEIMFWAQQIKSTHGRPGNTGLHDDEAITQMFSKPQLNQSDPIFFNAKIVSLDHLIYNHCYTRKKGRVRVRLSHVENGKLNLSCRFSDLRKQSIGFRKPRRIDHLLPLVSADDGVTVNGSPQAETDNDVEELRYKLNHSLQDEDYNTGLVQLLYDAARVLERAIKEQSSLSKKSWFSTAWFGVDRNACVKAISYQASVYCLLQAANEISSRGDGKDRDINVFVQRSKKLVNSFIAFVALLKLFIVMFYGGISNTSKAPLGTKHEGGPPNREAIPLKFVDRDHSAVDKESESFDKALENVEGALLRLEEFLEELHVSSSISGKELLKAACSDLERIRKLKKEAEFFEATFRVKAASLQQVYVKILLKFGEQREYSRGQGSKSSDMKLDRRRRDFFWFSTSSGFWSFLIRRPARFSDLSSSTARDTNDAFFEQENPSKGIADSESNEIQRFELLRSELMELEKCVQKSTNPCEYEEEDIVQVKADASRYGNDSKNTGLVQVQKKTCILAKSLDKLKATSTDVLQGTQLLAVDAAAALGLLRRVLIRDELTKKEKQALRRTLTDLASVVPIGFLMLLPVTAVGHAAMLAAIQRYMPITSTYGAERLDLLRQLEKVKEMEDDDNAEGDEPDIF
ncbi:hypothetical protein BUALT_Bualt09G0097500 [Buddleja alternifolia]|uniref:LETM1-like protein n=1 Tax=Buddleja alternifolia TaxID=168488 RepID=A0AAV6X8L7_9LAMI|nr:hypothetical protein BUALT_Bualt09G0097500 [Buddleja alternifolia]